MPRGPGLSKRTRSTGCNASASRSSLQASAVSGTHTEVSSTVTVRACLVSMKWHQSSNSAAGM